MTVAEPAKEEVLAWTPGRRSARKARVMAADDAMRYIDPVVKVVTTAGPVSEGREALAFIDAETLSTTGDFDKAVRARLDVWKEHLGRRKDEEALSRLEPLIMRFDFPF
jgi:hypothetical protein